MRGATRLIFSLVVCSGCASTSARPIAARYHQSGNATFDRIATIANRAARKHAVPYSLVLGVIHVESRFQPGVCSSVGACGLMQLMPRTAESLAERLGFRDFEIDDPEFNIQAGTAYLKYLLDRFDGKVALALAAYNSGPARVRSWLRRGDPMPGSSQRYVDAVIAARSHYARFPTGTAAPIDGDHADGLDRDGLRALVRDRVYGDRPDVAYDEDLGDPALLRALVRSKLR